MDIFVLLSRQLPHLSYAHTPSDAPSLVIVYNSTQRGLHFLSRHFVLSTAHTVQGRLLSLQTGEGREAGSILTSCRVQPKTDAADIFLRVKRVFCVLSDHGRVRVNILILRIIRLSDCALCTGCKVIRAKYTVCDRTDAQGMNVVSACVLNHIKSQSGVKIREAHHTVHI
jgi:hypothetical protein